MCLNLREGGNFFPGTLPLYLGIESALGIYIRKFFKIKGLAENDVVDGEAI